MRRFPPPPGGHSTPARASLSATTNERRSTEAPMEYEWQQPRSIPTDSPFRNSFAGEDGERAKKRTHYEAMDIDTPPRPQASFPLEATASNNPLGFGTSNPPRPPPSELKPGGAAGFDTKAFDAEKALGLQGEEDLVGADMSIEEPESIGKELSLLGASTSASTSIGEESTTRRRKASTRRKVPTRAHIEEEEEEHDDGAASAATTSRWRPPTKSDFSFQVHHHHSGTSAAAMDGGGVLPAGAGKWLNSNTPYVLLGYLQFASLSLLAILFLSLSLLFLYTLYVDIQSRLRSLTYELRAEILSCAKMYVDNRCDPETRLPALERKCAGWEECMGQEVVIVGKTRVVAETLAEVVNGFVDVISFKTMFFVILTLGLCIYGSSVALSLLPSRTPANPPSSPATGHPPQFQHLGYYPPPPSGYGYLPAPGNGQAPWLSMGLGSASEDKSGAGPRDGLEAPTR